MEPVTIQLRGNAVSNSSSAIRQLTVPQRYVLALLNSDGELVLTHDGRVARLNGTVVGYAVTLQALGRKGLAKKSAGDASRYERTDAGNRRSDQ